MIDQVLMFWPTVRPRYSLTSQKRASLTWEKNSEPAADGQHQQGGLCGGHVAASGARIPDAVMVATVAEPVASRMRTATNQAAEVLRGRTHHRLMPAHPEPAAIMLHGDVAEAVACRDAARAERAMRAILDEAQLAMEQAFPSDGSR
jgi:hypothetical protein